YRRSGAAPTSQRRRRTLRNLLWRLVRIIRWRGWRRAVRGRWWWGPSIRLRTIGCWWWLWWGSIRLRWKSGFTRHCPRIGVIVGHSSATAGTVCCSRRDLRSTRAAVHDEYLPCLSSSVYPYDDNRLI